jgi:hypothetical protein
VPRPQLRGTLATLLRLHGSVRTPLSVAS